MYSQNHQQGHNPRLNGSGRGMPNLLYNYQQHQQHHPSQNQHHQGLQQDHSLTSNGLGHHGNFSANVLSNSSPFNANIANGHGRNQAAQAAPPNEMWAEQLKVYKDSERAHTAMTEQQQPHYYARLKSSENKGLNVAPAAAIKAQADGENDLRRPQRTEEELNRQDWHNMDLSGQGLRNLAPELFRYKFLSQLYIASNRLARVPKQIGELRQLTHLDLSYNQITDLPPELGMCTYLKKLLLFNNNITELPVELGSLHQLDMLGIEGNPLREQMRDEIVKNGTKSFINYLREAAPRKSARPCLGVNS